MAIPLVREQAGSLYARFQSSMNNPTQACQPAKGNRMRTTKPKFEVYLGGEWCRTTQATIQSSGWLHYELRDRTIGLMPPKKWRLVEANATNRTKETT